MTVKNFLFKLPDSMSEEAHKDILVAIIVLVNNGARATASRLICALTGWDNSVSLEFADSLFNLTVF